MAAGAGWPLRKISTSSQRSTSSVWVVAKSCFAVSIILAAIACCRTSERSSVRPADQTTKPAASATVTATATITGSSTASENFQPESPTRMTRAPRQNTPRCRIGRAGWNTVSARAKSERLVNRRLTLLRRPSEQARYGADDAPAQRNGQRRDERERPVEPAGGLFDPTDLGRERQAGGIDDDAADRRAGAGGKELHHAERSRGAVVVGLGAGGEDAGRQMLEGQADAEAHGEQRGTDDREADGADRRIAQPQGEADGAAEDEHRPAGDGAPDAGVAEVGRDDGRDDPAGREQRGHVAGPDRRQPMDLLQEERREDVARDRDAENQDGEEERADDSGGCQ